MLVETSAKLSSGTRLVVVPYSGSNDDQSAVSVPRGIALDDFIAPYGENTDLPYGELSFDDPEQVLAAAGETECRSAASACRLAQRILP